jgi:ATP-dependent DNA helicase RecG
MSHTTPVFDVTPFLTQDEGQHFDRKSLYHGPPDRKRSRNRREVRDQVARFVAGFANAEGGILILGIEDDRAITGHALPADVISNLLAVPQTRLQPAMPLGFQVAVGEHELLVFDVPTADVPVQVTGDGFPLRIGDQTVQASETQIRNLKLQGMVESWEGRPSQRSLEDLDRDLLAKARHAAGLAGLSDEEYLLKRKLADRRGSGIALRQATELLFARLGPDHPNAGVRLFRVVGTERRTGAEHNVEERPRIEGNLPEVWEEAVKVLGGLMRQPSRLVGNRFRQVSEYPRFSWQEALLNALAHRDYGVEGACTEVWLFDDRMEVVSPGSIVPGVTLEELLSLKRVHCSRNPRIMRTLVDLGMARDQGEGIPRMFAEMADAFLPTPQIDSSPRGVTVALLNTTILTEADRSFITRIGGEELSDEEFRALLHAHRNERIDNADLRALIGLDALGASQVLRHLRDRELLELHPAGPLSYYTLVAWLVGPADRGEQAPDRGEQAPDRGEQAPDRGEQAPDRGEPLSAGLQQAVAELGARPRKDKLRRVIALLCEEEWRTPAELAQVLSKDHKNLTERHLGPMTEEGVLERLYPDTPTDARQAYRTLQESLFRKTKP